MQGTKGIYFRDRAIGERVYIEGRSPKEHAWEPAARYREEYEHPLVKNLKVPEKQVRGHGGTSPMMWMRWMRLLDALQRNAMPDWDVIDSVTSSAISPLSEMSVADRSKPVDFPDFSRGTWKTRSPITMLDTSEG